MVMVLLTATGLVVTATATSDHREEGCGCPALPQTSAVWSQAASPLRVTLTMGATLGLTKGTPATGAQSG